MKQKTVPAPLDFRKVKSRAILRDLTINDLARELGISHPYLHDLIRNRRTAPGYAEKIALILDCPVDELLDKGVTHGRP